MVLVRANNHVAALGRHSRIAFDLNVVLRVNLHGSSAHDLRLDDHVAARGLDNHLLRGVDAVDLRIQVGLIDQFYILGSSRPRHLRNNEILVCTRRGLDRDVTRRLNLYLSARGLVCDLDVLGESELDVAP